jgi:hypothetical protein
MKKLIVTLVSSLFAVSVFSQAFLGGIYGLPTKTAIRSTDQVWIHKLNNVSKPDSFVGISVLNAEVRTYLGTVGIVYADTSSRKKSMTRKACDSLYLKLSTLPSVIGNTNIGGGDSITDAGGITARMILNQTLVYNQNSVRDISASPQIVAGSSWMMERD